MESNHDHEGIKIVDENSDRDERNCIIVNQIKYILSEEDSENMAEYLTAPSEKNVDAINFLCANLVEKRVTPETAKNPRVIEGYKQIQKFVDEHREEIDQVGGTVVVYGSMEFDDPNNLDYDIAILVDDSTPKALYDELHDKWKSKLDNLWDELPDATNEGNLSVKPIRELEDAVIALENMSPFELEAKMEALYYRLGFADVILTGLPYYGKNKDNIELVQQRVQNLASQSPILLATLRMHLEETLSTREERSSLDSKVK